MRRPTSSAAATGLSLWLAFAGVATPEGSDGPESKEASISQSPNRPLSFDVYRALLLARQALGGTVCRGLFAEFRDASGHTLQEKLDAAHEDGQTFLSHITLVGGGTNGLCGGHTLAFTTPSSRTVCYCESFSIVARSDPKFAAAVLLHEELHSLGLGENPPSSADITLRVRERCGL